MSVEFEMLLDLVKESVNESPPGGPTLVSFDSDTRPVFAALIRADDQIELWHMIYGSKGLVADSPVAALISPTWVHSIDTRTNEKISYDAFIGVVAGRDGQMRQFAVPDPSGDNPLPSGEWNPRWAGEDAESEGGGVSWCALRLAMGLDFHVPTVTELLLFVWLTHRGDAPPIEKVIEDARTLEVMGVVTQPPNTSTSFAKAIFGFELDTSPEANHEYQNLRMIEHLGEMVANHLVPITPDIEADLAKAGTSAEHLIGKLMGAIGD